MEVICLEDRAFHALVDEVMVRLREQLSEAEKQPWVDGDEAMKILGISSKTTLQKLRDTGSIRFSQPYKKWIVYDRRSLLDYLDSNAQETF